jgi:glycosyltransferase involved in cell wall biosynthesis
MPRSALQFSSPRLTGQSRRPRVLFLAPTFGNWIHGRRALSSTLRTGFETFFVDWHDPQLSEDSTYTFIRLPQSRRHGLTRLAGEANARRIDEWFFTWWLKRLWNKLLPDIVHVCWIDFRAALCARAGMTPLILSAWGSDINLQLEAGADPAWRGHTIEALRSASLTTVDSPALISKCQSLAGRAIRSEVLHLGIDTQTFRSDLSRERAELRAQLGISNQDVLISSMRALSPAYNHEIILDAFAAARSGITKRAYLLFKTFNAEPSYAEKLKIKVREYGIGDQVRFVDEMPEAALPSLYAATDLVVNYPRQDGFPVTLLEAAACQRIVICAALETYSDMIADDNIIWTSENSCFALTNALIKAANAYEYSDNRFPRARATVVSAFSRGNYQERLVAIYEGVMAAR